MTLGARAGEGSIFSGSPFYLPPALDPKERPSERNSLFYLSNPVSNCHFINQERQDQGRQEFYRSAHYLHLRQTHLTDHTNYISNIQPEEIQKSKPISNSFIFCQFFSTENTCNIPLEFTKYTRGQSMVQQHNLKLRKPNVLVPFLMLPLFKLQLQRSYSISLKPQFHHL